MGKGGVSTCLRPLYSARTHMGCQEGLVRGLCWLPSRSPKRSQRCRVLLPPFSGKVFSGGFRPGLRGGFMSNGDCPFCQIARGEMDTEFVHEEENLVAFEDLDPKAPVHVLAPPREQKPAVTDVPQATLKQLVDATQTVAEQRDVAESGYAIRINNGEDAGQEVEHLHIHVIGGRELGMP